MKGSEKQVAWAKDIIEGAYRTLDCMDRNVARNTDGILGLVYDSKDVEAVRAWLHSQLDNVEDASAIIGIRNRLDQTSLEKLAEINHKNA